MYKAIQQQNHLYRWYKIQRYSNWGRNDEDELWSLLLAYCLELWQYPFNTLYNLSPQILEVQANELSLRLWRVAIFSLLFANSVFSCIARKGVILNIFCHPWSTPQLRGEHSRWPGQNPDVWTVCSVSASFPLTQSPERLKVKWRIVLSAYTLWRVRSSPSAFQKNLNSFY